MIVTRTPADVALAIIATAWTSACVNTCTNDDECVLCIAKCACGAEDFVVQTGKFKGYGCQQNRIDDAVHVVPGAHAEGH